MDDINRRIKAYQRMRGVGPPSRAWEARVIAVIRHPQDLDRIAPIDRLSQDAGFFYSGKLYESRMKLKSDITTISETQFSAGVEQGLAEGSRQKAFETAKLMRKRDYPTTEICLMTGLSPEEVETL